MNEININIETVAKKMVSVIIPAYKSEFLKDAISSVLSQSYTIIELIIVNDNSPNDITSVVKSFDDIRIRYYENDSNLGRTDLVANWNKCLSYVTGDYFSLLCDDDLYDPFFIERMVDLANKFPHTNVFRSRVKIIDSDNEIIDYYPSSPEWESTTDYMWHVFKNYRWQTVTEFMYRTYHIRDCGGYVSLPLGWYSDFFSVFVFSVEGGIVSTNECLVSFRMSGNNITSLKTENSEKKLLAAKLFKDYVVDFIKKNKFANENVLLFLLKKRVLEQSKFVLIHTSFKTLFKVYFSMDKYELKFKDIFVSFIRKILFI
ncbi:MAG: glycosyltransferase family 2 protein [Bacteroidia bacterium]